MTFLELQTEVFARIEESQGSPVFCSLIDVKQAINDCYEEISEWSGWNQGDVSITKLAQTYYDLTNPAIAGSSLILWPRFIWNETNTRWLRVGHYRDLDVENFEWQRARGEPDVWFMRGTWTFGTFPRPNAGGGTLTMNCAKMPAALVADADTPGFPQEFHYGIVEGALADLLAQDREPRLAKGHMQVYVGIREGLKNWVQKRDAMDHRGVLGKGVLG